MRRQRLIVFGTFLLYLLIGVAIHDDYGVSVDEPALRKFGNDTFAYLFRGGPIPSAYDWQFHGPFIELLMSIATRVTGATDGMDIWFLHHFLTFLITFVGVVFFYLLAKKIFRDWKIALLGCALLVLSPRIFAHSFYNPKDIPAMSMFIICMFTLINFLERKTVLRLLIHSLLCGILVSLRIFGLVIPLLTLLLLITEEWQAKATKGLSRVGLLVALHLVFLCLFIVAFWPALWDAPLTNFLMAFQSSTSRGGGGFYFGEMIQGTPWHYLPVWIGITTPLLYSLLFCIGCVAILLRKVPTRGALIMLGWFFIPIAYLLFSNVGIFDEWRHVLFLFPAFILIGLCGVQWILQKTEGLSRWVMIAIIFLGMASPTWWMIRNHPYEYVYFSVPGQWIEGRFELDYWGLSYRAGLEWILENDDRPKINVYPVAGIAKAAADTLPLAEWERLYFVDPKEADYILDNFRTSEYVKRFPAEKELHSIVVDGIEILTIYRGPDTQGIFQEHSR